MMTGSTFILLLLLLLNESRGQDPPEPISPLHPNYEAEKGNMVQYRHGDILIGVLIRAHKRGKGENCSTVSEDGMQALEAINMVVDQVNGNATILAGMRLGTVMVDTCDVDTHALRNALNTFSSYFWNREVNSSTQRPVFAGVVGAFSSGVSTQTARLLQIFKIPQISPSSTTPGLSDKNRFPYFFRVVPSDTYQARAMVALAKRRRWNYVSLVYENDEYGAAGSREVAAEAHRQGICIATTHAIPRTPTFEEVNNIVDELLAVKKARAVIVFTKRHDAEMLIETAQANPQSRGYFQWIGTDGWSGSIPTNAATLNYSESLDGALTFKPKTSVIKSLAGYMANLTLGHHLHGNFSDRRNPWFPEYIARRLGFSLVNYGKSGGCRPDSRLDERTFETLSKTQTTADAALALVAALQKSVNLHCSGEVRCRKILEMAGTNQLAEEVYFTLKTITYVGINGDLLSFDDNQDGQAVYDLQMYEHHTGWSNVATYKNDEITWHSTSGESSDVESMCSKPCEWNQATVTDSAMCCWHCVNCPDNNFVGSNGSECIECSTGFKPNHEKRDCDPLPMKTTSFGSPSSSSAMAVGVLGIVMTMVFGGVFFRNINSSIVKATGQELCAFVLGGALLCFMDSFVLSAPASIASCAISRVLLAFGPTLMYSGLLTKTIRVVIIFKTKSAFSQFRTRLLKPNFQVFITMAFIGLQAFVVAIWFSVSPTSVAVTYPINDDVAFQSCNDVSDLSVLTGLVYPFILVAVCTSLATVNRRVPVGFNEIQYIGITMYATCVTWLAFLPIFITNASNVPLKVSTLVFCLNMSAIIVVVCLFGFRSYSIVFHPKRSASDSGHNATVD